MSDHVRREDDVHEAIPVDPPPRRRKDCPCCGSPDFVKFGRAFGGVEYLPAGTEDQMFTLARKTKANLRVCLDCGFMGWFMHPDALDGLRDRHE